MTCMQLCITHSKRYTNVRLGTVHLFRCVTHSVGSWTEPNATHNFTSVHKNPKMAAQAATKSLDTWRVFLSPGSSICRIRSFFTLGKICVRLNRISHIPNKHYFLPKRKSVFVNPLWRRRKELGCSEQVVSHNGSMSEAFLGGFACQKCVTCPWEDCVMCLDFFIDEWKGA